MLEYLNLPAQTLYSWRVTPEDPAASRSADICGSDEATSNLGSTNSPTIGPPPPDRLNGVLRIGEQPTSTGQVRPQSGGSAMRPALDLDVGRGGDRRGV